MPTQSTGNTPQPAPSPTTPHVENLPTESEDPFFGFTYQQSDGNRFLPGKGQVLDTKPLEIKLNGTPVWLVSTNDGDSSVWAAILENGEAQAFRIQAENRMVEEVTVEPDQIPAGMPPLLMITGGEYRLITPPTKEASQLTHPVLLPSSQLLVYIEQNGDLVFWHEAEQARLSVNALPDARILIDEAENILILTGATDRYQHGVLGDTIEASGLTIVQTLPEIKIINQIILRENQVFEGIAPIWVDLNEDGEREIIVTVSDNMQGAQIRVYSNDGDFIAEGPAIGMGNRWRHQIAVSTFGPQNEIEIVDVLTPHIGGVVEFYTLKGNRLEITASLPGYSSHTLGSRNLDRTLAGDFDGDNQPEVMLTSQDGSILAALSHQTEGIQVDWSYNLPSPISTNLAGAGNQGQFLGIGAGLQDHRLLVWVP